MMEMQPEAESYVGQVSCGGAVRRVDTGVLSELRRRVKPEVEETRERAASASLAADAMPMAGLYRRMLSPKTTSTLAERPCAAAP